ncbi:MAG: helix-turn-helix transcriptional regulator [Bacteroidota bacterium]
MTLTTSFEFEEIVLLTLGILHGNAYGVTIKDEIDQRLGRQVSIGALQNTLLRLEKKGCLASELGDTEASRGGKPKRYFQITSFGRRAMQESRDARDTLWKALPQVIIDMK